MLHNQHYIETYLLSQIQERRRMKTPIKITNEEVQRPAARREISCVDGPASDEPKILVSSDGDVELRLMIEIPPKTRQLRLQRTRKGEAKMA